jgi:hypothetical protein
MPVAHSGLPFLVVISLVFHIRLVLIESWSSPTSVLFLASAIYLYLSFLGWGLTCIALPRTLSQYRAWFTPWIGIMLAAVLGVRLSRLGMGATVAVYSITVVGVGVGILSALRKLRSLPTRSVPRIAFMFGLLATLLLALYPLLCLHEGLTTVSLGNIDPVTYAATARFLETGSIRYPPVCDVSRPLTCKVNHEIVWNSRPGTFLLISLLAGLFHLQAYEILTVLLAVVLALTPPVVGIFVKVVSRNRLAALIALLMSALSVNQLYFFYQGFAGQVFGEGCLIIAFILWWKAESDQKHWSSYAFILGLAISGMLELYQEDVPLFLIPWSVYFVLQLLMATTPRWRLACRYALPVGIAFALDPFAFWYCLVWLRSLTTVFGWPMPRWALPADVIGLMNVYLPGVSERTAAIASIPAVCLALWGFLYWRKPLLTLSVTSTALALLLYEYESLHYSYAYHKFAANLSFLLIGAFATGVARAVKGHAGFLVRRYVAGAAVTFLAAGCFLTAIPLIEEMKSAQLSVSPDLVELTAIKQLAGRDAVRLVEDRAWQQLWAVYFLDPVPTLLDKPRAFFSTWKHTGPSASPNVLTLVSKLPDASSPEYFTLPEQAPLSADQVVLVPTSIDPSLTVAHGPVWRRVLWQNSTYLLLGPGPQVQSLRLSGQTLDRWITSEGLTLDVPGEWVHLRPIIQLTGRTVFVAHLGGKLNVTAKLYLAGQPRGEVPATIEVFADHYALRIELSPADLPSSGEVHLAISFDKYFVPQQFGYNSDTRRLVIVMPEEVRLLSQAR